MASSDHEIDPERADVETGLEQAPEVEELRLAECTMVVMYGTSVMRKPASVIFFIISRQMTPLIALEPNPVEHGSPDQAEIAVDVLDSQAEQDRDEMVVRPPEDLAVQRIGPADLVTVDQIRTGHVRPQRASSAGSYCASPSV